MTLIASQCHSLKEKRAVVRKLKDRVRAHYRVPVSEVASQDTWQRIVFGFAVVGGERAHVDGLLGEIARYLADSGEREGLTRLAGDEREIIAYGAEPMSLASRVPDARERAGGASDPPEPPKDSGTSDGESEELDSWVPEAWRDQLDD